MTRILMDVPYDPVSVARSEIVDEVQIVMLLLLNVAPLQLFAYSSWRRHQVYGSVWGQPAGEPSHFSWRP